MAEGEQIGEVKVTVGDEGFDEGALMKVRPLEHRSNRVRRDVNKRTTELTESVLYST